MRSTALVWPRDGLRPMDDLFHQHILSAILESSWPRLEKMELFGVASDMCFALVQVRLVKADETLSRIRPGVGSEPVLDIKSYATRLFWLANSREG